MSAQIERLADGPQERRTEDQGRAGAGSFLRSFLGIQIVFLLFLLIASIPEAPSASSPLGAGTQMAIIGGVWALADTSALAVHAVRGRSTRTPR